MDGGGVNHDILDIIQPMIEHYRLDTGKNPSTVTMCGHDARRLRAALTPTGWKGTVIFGARIIESEAVTWPVLS